MAKRSFTANTQPQIERLASLGIGLSEPASMVMPFAYLLPFGEVTSGLLVLLGLFTRVGLLISALLLIGLTFKR
jgi:uncharacterized membrane protein YphA (DoxX/SURF4 family)